jgi:hypothetical protein
MAPASTDDVSPRRARRVLQQLIDEQVADRSDVFFMKREYYNVRPLGAAAKRTFGDQKSQMVGLNRVARSASTFGEVANFIKSQLGRSTSVGEDWRDHKFGYDLLATLEGDPEKPDDTGIVDEAEGHSSKVLDALDDVFINALQEEDESARDTERRLEQEVQRRLRLAYTREFIEHVVAHYKYLVSTEQRAA